MKILIEKKKDHYVIKVNGETKQQFNTAAEVLSYIRGLLQ